MEELVGAYLGRHTQGSDCRLPSLFLPFDMYAMARPHTNIHPYSHTYTHIYIQMGRMHSSGKGMASSAIPYKRTPASWVKATPKDVEEHVCKVCHTHTHTHTCIYCFIVCFLSVCE